MSHNETQNLANHSKFVPGYHFGLAAILLVNLGNSAWRLFEDFNFQNTLGLLMAVAFIGLYWYSRVFPVRVQDRVIRLEMRLRLHQLLAADLHPRIEELTPAQLVGLRFAADEELPDLVQEVLDGKLTEKSEIKKKIKNWQADHLRC